MMTARITSEQEKQFNRFVEDAIGKALKEVGPDKDGIQRLIERGGEFQAYIVAGITRFTSKLPDYTEVRSILGKDFISADQIMTARGVTNLSDRIKASEARMDKLVGAYLDGDIPREIYTKKKDEIMRATLALKEEKKDFAHQGNNWVEPLREWILDTKQATFLSSSSNFPEIASFVKKVGTNPLVRDKSARFAAPVPSQFVAGRRALSSFPAPTARADVGLTSREVSEM